MDESNDGAPLSSGASVEVDEEQVLRCAWREAAQVGPAALVLLPRAGTLVVAWANRSAGDLLGLDRTRLIGRGLAELSRPPDPSADPPGIPRPRSRDAEPDNEYPADAPDSAGPEPLTDWARLAHELARDGALSGEGTYSRLDGSLGRLEVRVRPLAVEPVDRPKARVVDGAGAIHRLPARGAPSGWLVCLADLTADASADAVPAVLATAARHRAERRFDVLAECAPIGIFASEAGLRLGYVNERFAALLDREPSDLLGTGWLDVVHDEDLTVLHEAAAAVLGGAPVEVTIRLRVGDGAPRWAQLRMTPVTTADRSAGFVGTAEDVTQRRSQEGHLAYQAHHDALTGLVSRNKLLGVLSELMGGPRGGDGRFAVLYIDLDGFKAINDTFGHSAGDRALVEVARRMQRVARDSDILARMSGDEFVVVLRHVGSAAEAEAAARRHLAALAGPMRFGGQEVTLSASIGVARPGPRDTPNTLLQAADRWMYQAKAEGPGLYRMAPSGPDGERS